MCGRPLIQSGTFLSLPYLLRPTYGAPERHSNVIDISIMRHEPMILNVQVNRRACVIIVAGPYKHYLARRSIRSFSLITCSERCIILLAPPTKLGANRRTYNHCGHLTSCIMPPSTSPKSHPTLAYPLPVAQSLPSSPTAQTKSLPTEGRDHSANSGSYFFLMARRES